MEILTAVLVASLVAAVAGLAAFCVVEGRRQRAAIGNLETQIEALASRPVPVPDPPRLNPVLDELALLRKEVAEHLAELGRRVAEIPRPEPPPPPPPRVRVAEEVAPLLREVSEVVETRLAAIEEALRESRAEDDTARLLRTLALRGFAEIEILDGPREEGGRISAVVEARREGMTFKGPVFLQGTDLRLDGLKPAYPMFP